MELNFTLKWIKYNSENKCWLVQDDLKLPDDTEEESKIEWSGWQFDSHMWNLLSTWQKKLARWLGISNIPKGKEKKTSIDVCGLECP